MAGSFEYWSLWLNFQALWVTNFIWTSPRPLLRDTNNHWTKRNTSHPEALASSSAVKWRWRQEDRNDVINIKKTIAMRNDSKGFQGSATHRMYLHARLSTFNALRTCLKRVGKSSCHVNVSRANPVGDAKSKMGFNGYVTRQNTFYKQSPGWFSLLTVVAWRGNDPRRLRYLNTWLVVPFGRCYGPLKEVLPCWKKYIAGGLESW